jgi:ribosomal protein S18 acetylase RimI-like enzyme
MYELRNLEKVSFEDITNTWNSAFSDYIVPVDMTPERIETYFLVSGVDKSQSFGAFYHGALVGLLINSVDTFRGRLAAYDAMTGIVPEHRGKGLFSQLFEHTRNSLRGNGITHYYLEVITTNEKACSIYKKKGGKVDREFSFVAGKTSGDAYGSAGVKVLPLSAFPKEELSEYEPSFSNRVAALHRNIADYLVAYAEADNRKTAAIFNQQGLIPQIMLNGADDFPLLHSVLMYLSRHFETLRIPNIPLTESILISELLKIGFEILVNQYEMCIEF